MIIAYQPQPPPAGKVALGFTPPFFNSWGWQNRLLIAGGIVGAVGLGLFGLAAIFNSGNLADAESTGSKLSLKDRVRMRVVNYRMRNADEIAANLHKSPAEIRRLLNDLVASGDLEETKDHGYRARGYAKRAAPAKESWFRRNLAGADDPITAVSFRRYKAYPQEKARYGGSTVTDFYVQQGDVIKLVRGYGKTPGERKTDAIRRFKVGEGE